MSDLSLYIISKWLIHAISVFPAFSLNILQDQKNEQVSFEGTLQQILLIKLIMIKS